MKTKALYFLVIAILLMIVGYSMHLTLCVHSNEHGFLILNFIAHLFIWTSVFFVILWVVNTAVVKVKNVSDDEIISEAYDLAKDASVRELNFMIVGSRIFRLISNRNFVTICNIIIQLSFGYLSYRSSGQFSIFFLMLVVSFFLTKYFVFRCWGEEMDEMNKKMSLDIITFSEIRESKKMN